LKRGRSIASLTPSQRWGICQVIDERLPRRVLEHGHTILLAFALARIPKSAMSQPWLRESAACGY